MIFLMGGLTAMAQQDPHIRKGDRHYRAAEFDKALSEYQQAKETGAHASDPAVDYNLGNTLFRMQSFDAAAAAYDNSLRNGEGEKPPHTYYNKGVALSKGNKLEASVEAYKNALRLDPADQDARINLQKALFELKRQQPQPDQQEEQQQEKQQDEEKRRPDPPGSLSQKQAEQLLKALSQREQQVQLKMQQLRNRSAGRQEKDW